VFAHRSHQSPDEYQRTSLCDSCLVPEDALQPLPSSHQVAAVQSDGAEERDIQEQEEQGVEVLEYIGEEHCEAKLVLLPARAGLFCN
jgi:hypothetical protein